MNYIVDNKDNAPLIQSAFDSIFSYDCEELISHIEVYIDDVCKNEFLKQIPIVKTVLATAKFGYKLKEKHFIAEFYKFLCYMLNVPLPQVRESLIAEGHKPKYRAFLESGVKNVDLLTVNNVRFVVEYDGNDIKDNRTFVINMA